VVVFVIVCGTNIDYLGVLENLRHKKSAANCNAFIFMQWKIIPWQTLM